MTVTPQLLTGSLIDYLVPTARDIPDLVIKGIGEGGAVAPPAAIANAVCDALAPFAVEFNRTPIKPEQIVDAVRVARPRQLQQRRL